MIRSAMPGAVKKLGRGVVRTFQLPPNEILTTLHAVGIIILVELLIRKMPLPRLSQLLGPRVSLEPAVPGAERMRLRDLPERGRRQVQCTKRVAHVWPFSQGPCLRSALVTGHLLRKHDPAIRLGLVQGGDDLYAHAWLEIDGRPLEHVAAFDVFYRESGETERRLSTGDNHPNRDQIKSRFAN